MSIEVCPHCGKTFKRLKSHLPHCKAAVSSKTPETARHVTTSQTPAAPAAAALSGATVRGQTSKQTKDKMAASPKLLPASPSSSASAKKQQPKVADQTKSPTLFSSPSPPPPPALSKPRRKSLRAAIEAAKLDHIAEESRKKTEESRNETEIQILGSDVEENTTDPHAGGRSGVGEQLESPAQKLLSQSGRGEAEVAPPGVGATLGSADRPSIQSRNVSLNAGFSSVTRSRRDAASLSAASRPHVRSDGQLSELHLFHSKPEPSALIPRQQGAARPPAASPVQQATPPQGGLSLKVDELPAAARTSPARVAESQLEAGKPNAAGKPAEGAQTSLGRVRLKELPTWLASRAPSQPRHVAGWRWYYRRYVDVKKGGVAGLSLLLAGCCVLGYVWISPHIKLSRWRKYH